MHVTAIGRTEILYNTIKHLREEGHTVECIFTCGAEDFYSVDETDFERLANQIDAAYHFCEDINDETVIQTLADSHSEVAVSVNWKYPIAPEALDTFQHGILNAHAGDLPRYRGNAAPNWAILNGESEVVLTVHRMSEEIDAGPILRQASIPITDDTYLIDIYRAMRTRFPELFAAALNDIESGDLTPRPQSNDLSAVLRGYPRTPKDSELDWSRPSVELDRLVRASAEPLFGAFTYLKTEKLTVWRARSEIPSHEYCGSPGQVAERRPEDGEVAVITGRGFLVLEELELEGGERRPAADIITSIRTRLGMDKTTQIRRLESRIEELECRLDKE